MIKCENGEGKIKGSLRDILSEFSLITYGIYNLFSGITNKEVGKVFVDCAVELGLLSKNELDKKFEELKLRSKNDCISARDEIMSTILLDLLTAMED